MARKCCNPKLFPLMKICDLIAPEAYWRASAGERSEVANGCGPEGWLTILVPDFLMGCWIEQPCEIHDWCYTYGTELWEKALADKLFRYNMRTIVKSSTDFVILRDIRLNLADKYYMAVRDLGMNAYAGGKFA